MNLCALVLVLLLLMVPRVSLKGCIRVAYVGLHKGCIRAAYVGLHKGCIRAAYGLHVGRLLRIGVTYVGFMLPICRAA